MSASGLDPAAFVRPELRALDVYHLDLAPCLHKLDQNEVPWDLPRRLKRRIAAALLRRDWARYPDFHCAALRAALAGQLGWRADGVLIGNGSNELLSLVLAAVVAPGGEVLIVEPSFGLYRGFVLRAAGIPRAVPSGADLRLPLAALRAEIERDPSRPVVLCTPNNPTGAAATPAEVESLLERLRAPLLLDNAYGEFCDHDYLALLRRHPQLVLFRTFSKAWSLAGLRLGYLLADPALVGELLKVKLPYNVGHAAAEAGLAALDAQAIARRRITLLRGRRAQWVAVLERSGLEVFPSQANFVLARCAGASPAERASAARRLTAGLAERGIRVRDVGAYPGLAGCLRVSVGNGRALRDVGTALRAIGVSR